MYHILIISAIIAVVAGTGMAQTTPTLTFQVDGTSRSCVVHVPDGIEKPAVVFFLHGAGGNGPGFANDTKGNTTADREKFIAVYPSGVGGNWDYNSDGSNDFKFMFALIDTLDARYQVDRDRLYVAGFSMGGGMCFALGCRYSEVFAAIAPVSAAGSACTPDRKIPVLLTFGTKDMYPPANYMTSLERWAAFDGCTADPEITSPYPADNSQSVVTRISYGPCDEGTYVVADSVHNGGHGWPTDARTSVNQADEVWAFCSQFSLKGSTAVDRRVPVSGNTAITATYVQGTICITGAGERCRVKVIDCRGRMVASAAGTSRIAVDGNPGGVYLVIVNGMTGTVVQRVVVP